MLYLAQDLLGASERLKRPLVYTNYVSDVDDVVAVKDPEGNFIVPPELKNEFDWQLFQELEAQAEVIITSSAYLRRFAKIGEAAENVLTGFEPGGAFENLGRWRFEHGYTTQNPDIAVVTRSLMFPIPGLLKSGGRRLIVFTTNSAADSDQATMLKDSGIFVVGCGIQSIDGKVLIDHLGARLGYRTIEMTTGPAVLEILLQADVLDRMYVSRVQRKIPAPDPASVKRIFPGEARLRDQRNFLLTHEYVAEKTTLEDGSIATQHFLRYDHSQSTAASSH